MTAPISKSISTPETRTPDSRSPKHPPATLPLEAQEVSADGAQVSRLSNQIAAALEANDQKIEALKKAIASGTYTVDPAKVAEKLLQSDNPD